MDPLAGAPRIVYVEDDRLVFRATERMAAALGLSLLGAESGEAARSLLDGVDPAVLLIDASLPDCDGVELANELAARVTCPIVMVSGRKRPVGIEYYWLSKPFRRAQFEVMLEAVVPELALG